MDYAILEQYGVDTKGGLQRCMNDEAFYAMFVQMFLDDDSYRRAEQACEQRDCRQLFACLHELKGASGNAALMELYHVVCPLVELLRGETSDEQVDWAFVGQLFGKIRSAYDRTVEGIRRAM